VVNSIDYIKDSPLKQKITISTIAAFAVSSLAVFGPAAPRVSAVAGCSGFAYWTNSNSRTVEVINLTTNTSVASIANTGASQRAAVSPDGSQVIVAGAILGVPKASIIDTATNTVTATVTVGNTPLGVVFHPTKKIAYVANYGANTVSVINLATNTVTTSIASISGAYGLAISADGSKLYATAAGGFSGPGYVKVIDTVTNTVSATITVGTGPNEIRISADGAYAYTTNQVTGTSTSISKIDLSTNTTTATWSLTGTGSASSPRGIALGANYMYVGMPITGVVAKVDISSGSATYITAGSTVQGVLLSLDGTKLYVSQNAVNTRSGPELEIFSTSTDTSIGFIPAAITTPNPTMAAICPSGAPTGAPEIQLSSSSGSVMAGASASSLYTVDLRGWVVPTSYSISPAVPAGMTFNATTGLLGGSPTTPQSSTTYTVTAANGGQTSTATFALTVTLGPPNISLSTSSGTATVGTAANSLYTISQSGGDVASYSISPAAPAGMTFNTSTGLLSGTPTAALATTLFTITATNATSTDSEAFTLTIAAAPTSSSATSGVSSISNVAAPTLVTSTNQAQLEAKPGTANAIINGKEVAVEVVKAPVEATTEQLKRTADSIVADIADLLPAGVANPVSARTTPSGVVINGIMVNPDDPKEKLGVPVESVQLVKAGDTAVLLAALNQTNLPAEKGSGGALEVTRGGLVSATAYGLPGNETGEIVLMSTPRLLQTFTVDKNGGFKGQVPLPKDIAFGSHTVVMATKNAKVSLGIKLVRTKMQFRIKRRISSSLFLNRAGVVKVGGGKITVRGAGRCRASAKRVVMASKPGGCYVTVRQAAKGANKAIYYRFTVSVVKKLPKKVATKKK
jgi:YVTN family beta-propeller protein